MRPWAPSILAGPPHTPSYPPGLDPADAHIQNLKLRLNLASLPFCPFPPGTHAPAKSLIRLLLTSSTSSCVARPRPSREGSWLCARRSTLRPRRPARP